MTCIREDTKGGITFGHFDAFAGVSLDDGTSPGKPPIYPVPLIFHRLTWQTGYAYPGDVHNVVHQVAGTRSLWPG